MLGDHVIMQTELATSRNGVDWTFHGIDPAYINVTEDRGRALATHGLVQRGDEIWQYAEVESSRARGIGRARQRLDGFTCFSAGSETGSMITKPLLFEGDSLSLNVAARGKVRVAVLNPDGTEIPEFGLDDCLAIEQDAVKAPVRWKRTPPLAGLAGTIVRLKFEMENADLFAFEFE
jgi:hypothetical protein